MNVNGTEQNEKHGNMRWTPKTIAMLGILLAMEIVLSRFLSIAAWNIKIGFSFVPVVIAAMFFGPVSAALLAGLGDLLGSTLFPIGPYFPGFTLTAVLTGLTFGLLLHRTQTLRNTVVSVLIVQLLLGLLLNTLWISLLYGSPFAPLFATRAVQSAILIVVQIVTIQLLAQVYPRLKGKVGV